jgi:peptidoglycan/LPS O-acetylase OafA/YrhL
VDQEAKAPGEAPAQGGGWGGVSGRLSATIALYLLFLAAWSLLNAIRAQDGGQAWRLGLMLVWVALAAEAVAAVLGLAGDGHRLSDPPTFWGYLAASVLILPVSAARLTEAPPRTASLAFAVVLVALCVVVWRLNVLWNAG